jgi:uncharacterized protein YjiS (DUF1127 family)
MRKMAYVNVNHSNALAKALTPKHQANDYGVVDLFSNIAALWQAVQLKQKLRHMPPHLLKDIGLTDHDIILLQPHKEYGHPDNLETLLHRR